MVRILTKGGKTASGGSISKGGKVSKGKTSRESVSSDLVFVHETSSKNTTKMAKGGSSNATSLIRSSSSSQIDRHNPTNNDLILQKNILLPAYSYAEAVPKPEKEIGVKGKELSDSKKKRKEWEQRKEHFNAYVEKNQFPFLAYWRSNSFDYVPPKHFNTKLQTRKAIAEKPAFLTKNEKKDKNNYSTTKGNQIQTRVLNGYLTGVFSQRRSGASKNNPTPLIFKTQEVRADNDDIGHYIAAMNNMYAWGDPYLPYLYVQDKKGKWKAIKPDPLRVNRAHVKSMLDSAGFEQGKIVGQIISDELGSNKVLTYRDSKGDTQNLSLSEQQLAVAHQIVPKEVVIKAETPRGAIYFTQQLENIQIKGKKADKIVFKSLDKPESKNRKLTSGDLLIAVVRRHNMQMTTAQAIAESLYRQGCITYPRTDASKAEAEEVGVELLRPISQFKGSVEERKVLEVIDEANKALKSGKNYLINGYYELWIGNKKIATTDKEIPFRVFSDEKVNFRGSEVDLSVEVMGITPEMLVNFLNQQKVGTPATQKPMIEELFLAGIISTQVVGTQQIYRPDQRAFYMASAFDYLQKNKESQVTELGRKVKEANSLQKVKDLWNFYEPVNEEKLSAHIRKKTEEYLKIEKSLVIIEDL